MRGEAENSALDEVLRSLSAGTGIGRGLRGSTVLYERPVGLSSSGGEERSVAGAVRLSCAFLSGDVLRVAVFAVIAATGSVVRFVAVVVLVVVVVVVVMTGLRVLIPGKDIGDSVDGRCHARRWVTQHRQ